MGVAVNGEINLDEMRGHAGGSEFLGDAVWGVLTDEDGNHREVKPTPLVLGGTIVAWILPPE